MINKQNEYKLTNSPKLIQIVKMKIATFNVKFGNISPFSNILNLLLKLNLDTIVLQEIKFENAKFISQNGWPNILYGGGNCIISKYPIYNRENHFFSNIF